MLPRLALLAPTALLVATATFGAPALPDFTRKTTAAPDVVSVRDFFRPLALKTPQLNSSGTHLVAFAELENDQMAALLINLKTGEKSIIRAPNDHDICDIDWLDDRYLVLNTVEEKRWIDSHYIVDTQDPTRMEVRKGWGGVYKNPAPMGKRKIPSDQLVGYLYDRNNSPAYAVAIKDGIEHLFISRDFTWVPLPLDLERYHVVATGNTDDELLAIGPRQEDKPRALLRVSATTGQAGAVLYQDDRCDPDIRDVLRRPVTHAVTGVRLYRDKRETIWFNRDLAELQVQLDRLFSGMTVSILGRDVAAKQIVFETVSDRSPPLLLSLRPGEGRGAADHQQRSLDSGRANAPDAVHVVQSARRLRGGLLSDVPGRRGPEETAAVGRARAWGALGPR
jgi:hypothetical protein